MAEVLVSVVLEQLGSILSQQIQSKVTLVADVDEEIQKLTSNLQSIEAVLEDAENRQVTQTAVKDWLDKLQDTAYDIEDVLDEWSTEIQKLQMEKVGKASMIKRKVCCLIPSYCFSPRQVVLRHHIANGIKNLNKKLDNIAMEQNRWNFSSRNVTKEPVQGPITTSFFSDGHKVYGRDNEKKTIMNFLLSESNQGPILPIISIVGMGGLGKTTLTRLVFNDDEVKTYFNLKIWVCVSHPFDELRVAKEILQSLTKDAKEIVGLQNVLERIQKYIEGKKLFLVLDDVWTDSSEKWQQLKGSLECASQGSRILMTTHKESTSKVMRTMKTISLEKLSEEECWSLFSQIAFFNRTNEERENLENIGRQIVHNCNGLPLAIKTIGSHLMTKTEEQWQSVLDDEVWKREDIGKGIFPPLMLSYYDLPSKLRKCFLYCAIFPKDHIIEKDTLIKLWMAQDYLTQMETKI